MPSPTRRALQDFDNPHDFERLCADILNALGYSGVEPMAPGGGADRGVDIRFREGEACGVALVTLEKQITSKYASDLAKLEAGTDGVLALFCAVDVAPGQKMKFAQAALERGYRLEVFDLERLRSLLDGSLTALRRHYLHIDDSTAAALRAAVSRLVRFPSAAPEASTPPTLLEGMIADQLPRRLFELLMSHAEDDVRSVPGIGDGLHAHMLAYYAFRVEVSALERTLLTRVGRIVAVRFPHAWAIYLRYFLARAAGLSRNDVEAGGNFLNYGITWDDAERVYGELISENTAAASMSRLSRMHEELAAGVRQLAGAA